MLRLQTDESQPRPAPGPDRPAREAIAWSIGESVRRLLAAAPKAREGDPEAVHRMRVATRRLRSDLSTWGPLVHDAWARPLRAELKWLGHVLGDLRDRDVLGQRLRRDLDVPAALALGPLLQELREERVVARQALLEALANSRFDRLSDRLAAAATAAELTRRADKPCREVLPPLVRKVDKKLRKAGRDLAPESPDESYHRLRIRAKRARYAAEAVAPFLGRKAAQAARRYARAAAQLQDVLGEHQDATHAGNEILRVGRSLADVPELQRLAVGPALFERAAAQAARESFPEAWRRLDRSRLRRWFRKA